MTAGGVWVALDYHRLHESAQQLAQDTPGFFEVTGPGVGDRRAARFHAALAREILADPSSGVLVEQEICGESGLRPDFYFPDAGVIVEVALGLRNPNSEFERDVLKAVLAKRNHPVERLVFITRPGGEQRCKQPAREEIRRWALEEYGISIEVHDLVPPV